MLVKSNSVPNFLFEKPVSTRRYSLVLTNKKKIVSYGEFITPFYISKADYFKKKLI
jgi:hypothetical protein